MARRQGHPLVTTELTERQEQRLREKGMTLVRAWRTDPGRHLLADVTKQDGEEVRVIWREARDNWSKAMGKK